jgi:hypothetical protein
MPDIISDISMRIRVLNPQRQPLGGTVDIELKQYDSGQIVNVKGADASKDIDVSGLQRTPPGVYQVTVTPTDVFKPTAQFVTVPPSNFNVAEFIIDKGTQPGPQPNPQPTSYNLVGILIFDHGLPAAGITTRLYSVGFGGNDMKLGETKADAQGAYSISYNFPPGTSPSLQVRVLDPSGNEVTISNTKFNAQTLETLNLVVPSSVQPLLPEYQRLAADLDKTVGGIANLGQAQEGPARQDLTLLNQSTNWDARLVALAATAAQQTPVTGLGQDVLYSLYRVGLPTDSSLLAMVPSSAVQAALAKASQAGIISLNNQQIAGAVSTFQTFANKTLLATTSPGAASNYNDLLVANLPDATQRATFANLYFSNPKAPDFWAQAIGLKLPAATLDSLKLQGKFLYLTFNNATLAQKLQQDVGSLSNLSQLADKDYHRNDTWQNVLNGLAGTGGDQALQKLIPPAYSGKTTADRLAAYAGDLARKVRISFPTQVVARMIERNDLPLGEVTGPSVTAFLRAAVPLGYNLGQTPLNSFLKNSGGSLPALNADSAASLKTLHRLYQVTPSMESLQAAVNSGFTSALDIASYSKDEFLAKFGSAFPPGEAGWVYGQSQTVSAVTFNFFSIAKQLDTAPPVYALSPSDNSQQNAKNAIVQQFPSMASLFGNLDFCDCEDCRSVLSPAAYFVDALEFLNKSAPNAAGYTPLDVLIGSKDGGLNGRRPDLGALPLTCENTNTSLPYIDVVNEILEYYVAHTKLDTNYAYDTGTATAADLRAEPAHILPQVYSQTLKGTVFPLNLPFDLWIETVRGFLNYFKAPLAQILNTLRPADHLELFSDANGYPYYRAQILAEALGLSPSEYEVLTSTDSAVQPLVSNWFKLYGYPDEATALNGKIDPTNASQYLIPPLKSAKNLSQLLGLSYQELTDLVTTGFLNPSLFPLIYQFNRFGIDMSDAFSYAGQPGYPAFSAAQKASFETLLSAITTQYKTQNPSSTFDAKTWLTNLLPANYSRKVLVLADPNSGCDFGGTTLQYADNATAAAPLDFVKLNLFVRLWKKLDWTLDETDRALQSFFPSALPTWTDPNFGTAFTSSWKTALVYLAHLDDLNTQLSPALGRIALLPCWSNLPVQGENPLYAQLFLVPSVLNNDWAFDDPNGLFPTPASDFAAPPPYPPLTTFSAHQAAVEGVLGLTAQEIAAIFADAGAAVATVAYVQNGVNVTAPSFTLGNLSICYRYSALAKCLQVEVSDMIALKAMSNLNPFQALSGNQLALLADDVLFNQTLLFIKQVQYVQNSGFTVEDLKYLLRHQFDPVGKYQTDVNAQLALVQSIANGLQQIQTQNAVPGGPSQGSTTAAPWSAAGSYSPGQIVASAGVYFECIAPSTNNAPPNPAFWQRMAASTATAWNAAVTYGPGQIVTSGYVQYICRATNTNQMPPNPAVWQQYVLSPNLASVPVSLIDQSLSGLFPAPSLKSLISVLTNAQTFTASVSGQATAIDPTPFAQESALSFSYDSTTQTQSVGYLGYLNDWKKADLKQILGSPVFSSLLDSIQGQALAVLGQRIGDLLGVWASLAQYEAVTTVAAAIPPSLLMQADSALTLSYDQADNLEWLGYRGVLTDAKKQTLTTINGSGDLLKLLNDIQGQSLPNYSQLIGTVVAMWTNVQSFKATQSGVLDTNAFFSALATAQQGGTIVDPVPHLQFSYDSVNQVQVLMCVGVLTDSMQTQLAALNSSAVLASLLQSVHDQAVTLFQRLVNGLITTASADFDNYAQPFLGTDLTKQQNLVKADLVSVFLPLYAQKLSRQLIVQTLSTTSGSDPSLTETLLTDAALLTDPSNPGKSLLGAFLGLLQQGVSESYFASPDGSGAAQASGNAATVDTTDPTNSAPGTASAHFEGYWQALTDGPYRFFAELGNIGAAMQLQLDSPDPKALFSNPIISSSAKAAKDHDEVSQFVQLKGGVLYHFTVDFSNLGANGASLLIQGETLPKGPLSQILLYPQQNIIAFTRAQTLLAKTLQIMQVIGLEEREISYLMANASQFNGLNLSSLPTQASDDSSTKATALFSQFLALADYSDLRKGPAGGADGLIDVFQNVGKMFTEPPASQDSNNNPATPWARFASLTRRDASVVRAVAEYFGLIQDQVVGANRQVTAVGDFGNNKGIRRVWEALQLLQIVGIPMPALTASTVIASLAPPASSPTPDAIAANFKNAVKAQYTADAWRPIAQSVFDSLRQEKRDALVSYIMTAKGFESSNELFEYFLVDPGMEPVVQTSRIRLAMSSVQTFVQRCLLNLENGNSDPTTNVAPNAIDAEWWAWMKRYRVWQANREIFLFPENWMEPELRLDKTDLFQTFEGALLQGDVTVDLVEDALFEYLKGLDLRARLEIVSMYLDQDVTDPSLQTLYVLGRTYGHPHKYFFRTYAAGAWSGWTAVTPDIDGDHVTLAIWKGRLNVFWVTFISQPVPPASGPGDGTTVTSLKFSDLMGDIFAGSATPQYQVQLHWIEYFQGKWTNRISSDANTPALLQNLQPDFDIKTDVYIHVSKETDTAGNEGALRVHLDLAEIRGYDQWDFGYAFRVTSKNCNPDFSNNYWQRAQYLPYQIYPTGETEYVGAGFLNARIQATLASDGSETEVNEKILQTVNNYGLLSCANPVAPPYVDPSAHFYQDAGSLVAPFFFKDLNNSNPDPTNFSSELTFFVQPSLTETTIDQWSYWGLSPSVSGQSWSDANSFGQVSVVAQVQTAGPKVIPPGDPYYSVYPMQSTTDWLTNPATAISYGGALIGKNGGMKPGQSSNSTLGVGGILAAGTGAGILSGMASAGLSVVGKQGLSVSQARSLSANSSSSFAGAKIG